MINRRRFLKFTTLLAGGAVVSACAPGLVTPGPSSESDNIGLVQTNAPEYANTPKPTEIANAIEGGVFNNIPESGPELDEFGLPRISKLKLTQSSIDNAKRLLGPGCVVFALVGQTAVYQRTQKKDLPSKVWATNVPLEIKKEGDVFSVLPIESGQNYLLYERGSDKTKFILEAGISLASELLPQGLAVGQSSDESLKWIVWDGESIARLTENSVVFKEYKEIPVGFEQTYEVTIIEGDGLDVSGKLTIGGTKEIMEREIQPIKSLKVNENNPDGPMWTYWFYLRRCWNNHNISFPNDSVDWQEFKKRLINGSGSTKIVLYMDKVTSHSWNELNLDPEEVEMETSREIKGYVANDLYGIGGQLQVDTFYMTRDVRGDPLFLTAIRGEKIEEMVNSDGVSPAAINYSVSSSIVMVSVPVGINIREAKEDLGIYSFKGTGFSEEIMEDKKRIQKDYSDGLTLDPSTHTTYFFKVD